MDTKDKEINKGILQEQTPVEVSEAPKKDNPTLGVIFFILGGVSFSLNFILAKVLYERNPDLTPL